MECMARIPYLENVEGDLVESQRPDSLPEEYSHINQQAARNVYRSIAHEPDIVRTLRAYIGAMWDHSGLSDRERELLLLALANEIESEYEWHQHVRIAILEGLTPEDIKAVSASEFKEFSDTERAVMEFAQVASQRQATDADVDRLHNQLEVEEVASITALVGAYVCLAVIIDTLGVETEEPFVGWDLAGLKQD